MCHSISSNSQHHLAPLTTLRPPHPPHRYMDLGPYLNPSYYVVQEDTSLSKVYTLFRTLGLRHLCVIPK